MKIVLGLLCLALPALSFGNEYVRPIHSPEEVLQAVLSSEKLDRQKVKVVLLKYDYLKKEWHIELMPSDRSCIDCYPSFYVEDVKPLKIKKIPHG